MFKIETGSAQQFVIFDVANERVSCYDVFGQNVRSKQLSGNGVIRKKFTLKKKTRWEK